MHIEPFVNLPKHKQTEGKLLKRICELDALFTKNISNSFYEDSAIKRNFISFQANKTVPYYRWYKFKEAFSPVLVEYIFNKYKVKRSKIFDPFAGSGTSLFAGSDLGYNVDGIEILPLGQKIISANIIARNPHAKDTAKRINSCLLNKSWNEKGKIKSFQVFRITEGACPENSAYKIKRYLYELTKEKQEAEEIKTSLVKRMKTVNLELRPEKTSIVYCWKENRPIRKGEKTSFDFLGFTFCPRKAKSKTGERFISFLCQQ